tara:strand:- start:564 stop:878 length:315 start_codon:yes stop_codon:yes gene_type:complete
LTIYLQNIQYKRKVVAINKLLHNTANNPSPIIAGSDFSTQNVVEKLNMKKVKYEKGKTQKIDLFFLFKSLSIKKRGINEKKIKTTKNEKFGGQLMKKNKPEMSE